MANEPRQLKQAILDTCSELVETKQAFVFEIEPRDDGRYNYLIAQGADATLPESLQGIAILRSSSMSRDNILICWANGISADDHDNNIANGIITIEGQNFVPTVNNAFNLRVKETCVPNEKLFWRNAETGEVQMRTPKLNPKTGMYPTKDGNPIWRSVVPAAIGTDFDCDDIVEANGAMNTADFEEFRNAQCVEFEAVIPELEEVEVKTVAKAAPKAATKQRTGNRR